MKKTRIFAAIAVGVMVFSLTGCSLARPELPASEAQADRLIGVLITREYLDLFDMEGYLEDHAGQLAQGGELTVEESGGYQGRLYATRTTETLTNQENGETREMDRYVFEGVEGWAYLAPAMLDESGSRIGTNSSVDDAISDTQMHVTSTDTGETLELEGTLYVSDARRNSCYYVNPVYQQADGAVYAQSGNGLVVSEEAGQEGEYCSTTLDHSTTVTVDGVTETDQVSILIRLSVLYPPQEITVFQMDGENRILDQTSYMPGTLPEVLKTVPGCAYLLVETCKQGPEGEEMVSRQLVNPEEDSFQTFAPEEDGVCVAQWTQIQWN